MGPFGVDPTDRVCADLGASTGGFTEVLLRAGARRVYACDVGRGLLHERVRNDPRVVVREDENVRHLEALPEPIDLVVADLSFISITKVLPAIRRILAPTGQAVVLVKPQFEVGRDRVGHGGLVRKDEDRQDAIRVVGESAVSLGFTIAGSMDSPVAGARIGERRALPAPGATLTGLEERMRRSIVTPWIVAVALASSCTYISTAKFEEKRKTIDEDGDQSPWAEDCDDQNGDRSPGLAEVPYDGVDNDCGLDGDVVDQDGDGFPGISEDAYAALEPAEAFPEALRGKALDCADDPVAHPEAATIHPPPNDGEIPYDGLDSDCDGSNDFDADGDGYLPDTVVVDGATVDVASAFSAFVAEWGYDAEVAGWAPDGADAPQLGDCNDFVGDVHPNPPVPDFWYDGQDQDCDGQNDFDQDGDGWMPPGDAGQYSALYDQYVNAYYQGNPPWTLPADLTLPDGSVLTAFGDCLDAADRQIVAAPATVFPRVDQEGDAWYDGVDTNCWTDNDFDRDTDAFLPIGAEVAYATYVTVWGYQDREAVWGEASGLLAPKPGDCNDNDPDTYPEALERIGDGNDQDCDGNPDAAKFAFADWTWDRPSAPRATRIGDTYVMAVTASGALIGGTDLEEIGVALSVPLAEARTGAVPVAIQFKGSDGTRPVDEVVDIAPNPERHRPVGRRPRRPRGVARDHVHRRGQRLHVPVRSPACTRTRRRGQSRSGPRSRTTRSPATPRGRWRSPSTPSASRTSSPVRRTPCTSSRAPRWRRPSRSSRSRRPASGTSAS